MGADVAEMPVPCTDMGKKKPKHKTPRVNIGMPAEWHAVIRRLAAKRQQPLLYRLIALIEQEAEKEGLTGLPTTPWDEEEIEE